MAGKQSDRVWLETATPPVLEKEIQGPFRRPSRTGRIGFFYVRFQWIPFPSTRRGPAVGGAIVCQREGSRYERRRFTESLLIYKERDYVLKAAIVEDQRQEIMTEPD